MQIDIDASAERVWDTLTNIAEYPTWNPFNSPATAAEPARTVTTKLMAAA